MSRSLGKRWTLDMRSVKDELCARVAFTVSRTSMNALRAQRGSRASERHSCTAFTVNVIL
eukprot:6914888-Prymnesium_polylepis.1